MNYKYRSGVNLRSPKFRLKVEIEFSLNFGSEFTAMIVGSRRSSTNKAREFYAVFKSKISTMVQYKKHMYP